MNAATVMAVLQCQLEDVNANLKCIDNGEGLNDEALAFVAMKEELEKKVTLLQDHRAAVTMAGEEQASGRFVARIVNEEAIAVQDHEVARSLAGMTITPTARTDIGQLEDDVASVGDADDSEQITEDAFFDAAEIISSLGVWSECGDRQDDGESSSTSKAKDKEPAVPRITCVACSEPNLHFDVVELHCQPEPHTYCRGCILEVFERSIKDASFFPPRCCRITIPLEAVKDFLTIEFQSRFKEKSVELTTPNPLYCSNAACSEFIKSDSIKDDVGHCAACDQKTCSSCNQAAHEGLCPEDSNVKVLLQVAAKKSWQSCYKCKNMVELTIGCNHIT